MPNTLSPTLRNRADAWPRTQHPMEGSTPGLRCGDRGSSCHSVNTRQGAGSSLGVSSSSPDAIVRTKAPLGLLLSVKMTLGHTLCSLRWHLRYRDITDSQRIPLCTALMLLPEYILHTSCKQALHPLIRALCGAQGGGGDFLCHYRNRPQQRAVLSSCRPVSNDEIFYFGAFFFRYL